MTNLAGSDHEATKVEIDTVPHIRCSQSTRHNAHLYQADAKGSNRSAARFYCVGAS